MRTVMAASSERRQHTAGTSQPADNLTRAFCGVAARFRLRGVHGAALRRLYDRYLPDNACPVAMEGTGDEDVDEFGDLLVLLLDHRSDDGEVTEWLACAIATACFGNNHLWQDMGLPNRAVLSELLRGHFTALHDKNAGNMKWKKFFYKQLCERMHVKVCKAPSCGVCVDYHKCFGPEDAEVTN
jgi:nitrogen fixation protein NifQ